MGLSVIVTAYRSPETLRACVDRLQADPAVTQILIADCSETAPELSVEMHRFPTPTSVPTMRWAMLVQVTEPIVACLEGRTIPEPGWATALLAEHAAHPQAVAIGGAVDIAQPASRLAWAVWFCEYAHYAPPLPSARASDISGAHLSYKTASLKAQTHLLQQNAWETRIHARWRAQGRELRTCPATVTFHNGMSAADFWKQRLAYGRAYAATRATPPKRWLYALITPALPFLLTWRTSQSGPRTEFLRTLLPIFFFHTLWSIGELLGYCFGLPRKQRIY